jgi:hypothetical protein
MGEAIQRQLALRNGRGIGELVAEPIDRESRMTVSIDKANLVG